ncbi:MAG: formylglycine-generating enzyme family protein [Verrucomicrobiota bacterium]
MNFRAEKFICVRPFVLLAGLTFLGLGVIRGLADTALNASLVPAITISGPLNSLQQVQYSTNLADTNAWTILAHVRLDTTPKPYYDATAGGEKRFYRTKIVGVADTNLVWIPPGTFLMGSPTNEQGRFTSEGPQTLVTLTKGFLIGRFEVRSPEWLQIMGSYPSGVTSTNSNAAVDSMSWGDASNYCAIRTTVDVAAGRIPTNWFYRLPTEAEWEYACRAGTTTPFGIGFGTELRNDAVRMDANINGSAPYPTNIAAINPLLYSSLFPVGHYTPNAFGLYDMHGNIEEYCWDNLGGAMVGNLPGGAATNPVGLVGGPRPIVRGGAASAVECRSAFRRGVSTFAGGRGLRVVLIPADSP